MTRTLVVSTLALFSACGLVKTGKDTASDGAFSDKPVAADAATAKASAKTSFVAGEPIYARIFLTSALGTQLADANRVEVAIDHTSACDHRFSDKDAKDHLNDTSLAIRLSSEPEARTAWEQGLDCTTWPDNLSIGTHELDITVTTKGIQYKASTQLVVNAAAKTAWAERAKRLQDSEHAADKAQADATREMPKANLHDSKLEASLLAGWKEKQRPGSPLAVVITSRDWQIERDENTGALLGRKLFGYVAVQLDKTCGLDEVKIFQTWDGNTYARQLFTAQDAPAANIACDKIR